MLARVLLVASAVFLPSVAGAATLTEASRRVSTRSLRAVARPLTTRIRIDLDRGNAASTDVKSQGPVAVTFPQRQRIRLPGARHIVRLAAGDVDGDGNPELVGLTRRGRLRVFRNDGAGHFVRVRPRPRPHGVKHPLQGGVTDRAAPDSSTESPFRTLLSTTLALIDPSPRWDRAGPSAQPDAAICLGTVSLGPPRSPPLF